MPDARSMNHCPSNSIRVPSPAQKIRRTGGSGVPAGSRARRASSAAAGVIASRERKKATVASFFALPMARAASRAAPRSDSSARVTSRRS